MPPQVPLSASISSISPQRRGAPGFAASPYAYSNQQTFSYTQPLPSPQSYASHGSYAQPGAAASGYAGTAQQPNRHLRGRPNSGAYPPARYSNGGIMPTPDPTVGSAISDEDVALQLMRLGDPTAFSHGRTSTSTLDDALSGKAEAASSAEDSEDDEDGAGSGLPAVPRFNDLGPQRKKQRVVNEFSSDVTSGEDYDDRRDGTFATDGAIGDAAGQRKMSRPKSVKPRANSNTVGKPKNRVTSMSHPKVPMSPSSLPAQSRKGSVASTLNFQHQLGTDEEDLSSKPRCQRCR